MSVIQIVVVPEFLFRVPLAFVGVCVGTRLPGTGIPRLVGLAAEKKEIRLRPVKTD